MSRLLNLSTKRRRHQHWRNKYSRVVTQSHPPSGVPHHMNELMLLISLQRVLWERGNNHRPECTSPVGILAQTVTSVLNLRNNS